MPYLILNAEYSSFFESAASDEDISTASGSAPESPSRTPVLIKKDWGAFYDNLGCGRATPARSPTRWKYLNTE